MNHDEYQSRTSNTLLIRDSALCNDSNIKDHTFASNNIALPYEKDRDNMYYSFEEAIHSVFPINPKLFWNFDAYKLATGVSTPMFHMMNNHHLVERQNLDAKNTTFSNHPPTNLEKDTNFLHHI